MTAFLFLLCFSGATVASPCVDQREYIIGVEAIDYSPHYSFTENNNPSFFNLFIDWLNTKSPCQFLVTALPIKRLNAAYEHTNTIDFIYPDNPNWRDMQANRRTYSAPLVTALGGTMVHKKDEYITLSEFSKLAFPRGFTPVAWYLYQANGQVSFTETADALAALKMVEHQRVNGADIEYNVATYLMDKHKVNNLVLAKNLPFTPTPFHISTLNEHAVLTYISNLVTEFPDEIEAIKNKAQLIELLPHPKQ